MIIIGDKIQFALESGISRAYSGEHYTALGYFLIYIRGTRYGVDSPDATMLGCSYGEVKKRIIRRGTHTAPFATEADAGKIADAFRDAIYAPGQENCFFFGIQQKDFCNLFYRNNLMWAPDGDEAFDDGSYVLHFDVGNRVRLIAFKLSERQDEHHHDPKTLTDIWLEADSYYEALQKWINAFEAEWVSTPKTPN